MEAYNAPAFLESIRIAELDRVVEILQQSTPPGATILEIGAGTGWQAQSLAALGYRVSAIDVPSSNHRRGRIWPITDFDGKIIPFPNESFDVIYSSNVLEHVDDLTTLNGEIFRVLRPGGIAIHYVPTSVWRAWSLAVFFPALVRDLFGRIARTLASDTPVRTTEAASSNRQPTIVEKILRRCLPHAHGAKGSCISELHRFRKRVWDDFFRSAGWAIVLYELNGYFLTGDMLLGHRVSVANRKRLANVLGSTAHLYVVRRTPP